jgi:hypothetical protein
VETGNRLDRGDEWGGRGEDWVRIEQLLELARRAHREELSQERRERIREGLFEKLERRRIRRRVARAFVTCASAASIAGLVLVLVRRA